MWDNISNSSILFSKDFYKQKNENFYLNSIFINKVYYYYYNKGYLNIIINQIINICISIFIIFSMIFLINCVDYKGIITLTENRYISEFIDFRNFFNNNLFIILSLIIFFLIIINKIINVIDDSIVYKHIKKYYDKQLHITDDDLHFLKWNDIVNNIKHSMNNNIYYINNVITCKENYLIALFDNEIIQLEHLTSLMEWNLIYCILFNIFDSNFKLKENIFNDKHNIVKSINFTMKIISIINFIFMPFILTFLLLYNIFNYGEIYYNNPSLILSRSFTKKSKWKLRYYNELEHEFNNRIDKAAVHCNNYTKLFNNSITDIVFRLIIFICSSIFIILAILSLINDKILINLLLTPNQSVIWFLGILVSIIALLRKKNNNLEKPENHINLIIQYINLDESIINNPNLVKSKKKISEIFEYKYITLLKDIFYIIISPFQLWKLSYDIDNIVDFIINNTEKHDDLLYICKLSNFDNMYIPKDNKTNKSFNIFIQNYPEYNEYLKKEMYGINNTINIKI
jgi:autophagy-related protein 9